MTELITPETIATEIEMSRTATNNTIVVLEGENDEILLKNFFDLTLCEIVICYGKENAIDAFNLLNTNNSITGYIGVVDSDFDNLIGKKNIENIIYTEHHDIEMDIILSNSFQRIVDEYSTDKIKTVKFNGLSLQKFLFNKMYPLSLLKYLNVTNFKILNFNGINYNKFIDNKSLDIDIKKCVSEIHRNTLCNLIEKKKHALTSSKKEYFQHLIESLPNERDISEVLNKELINDQYPLEQISNGHDIIILFCIALTKAFASVDRFVTNPDHMHKVFRLSYGCDDFKHSSLYRGIKNWENKNSKFLII